MIQALYFACFVISVVNLFLLSVIVRNQRCFYYVIFFMLITISNFGYLMISISSTLEAALIGNLLTYFGAAFLPYAFLLCLGDLCKVQIPKVASFLMFFYNMVVFALVGMRLNGNMWYYSSNTLHEMYGVSYLDSQPGPAHFLHEWSLVFYAVCAVFILVGAFFQRKNVSYKNLIALIALEVITIVMHIVENSVDDPLDSANIMYIIDEFCLLFLIYRMGKYDVSESVALSLKNQEEYAYMVFDLKLNYLGCNDVLKIFFPHVTHVRVDRKIDPQGDPVIVQAVKWLKHSVETGTKEPLYVSVNARELKCTWRTIRNGLFGGKSGYLVELFDDTKQQRYMDLLTNYNSQLEEEVTEKLDHIKTMQDQIILGLSDIVESRDDSTGGHVKRTSEGVRILIEQLEKESEEFHLTKQFCENVIKAAPMHDLGKIAVDDEILRKPGRFTAEEYEIMKVHAGKGAEIVGKALNGLEDEEFMEVAKNIARFHHEKWNGAGYPEGLSGEEIPLEARIMALADVFDALVSKRCYKERYTYEEAFQIMEESMGSHFDPKLGAAFLKCRPELEKYYNQFEE